MQKSNSAADERRRTPISILSCILCYPRSSAASNSPHTGLRSRSLRTTSTTRPAAYSTSASVVNRPSPNRVADCTRSAATPIARSTWLPPPPWELQALPVETARSGSATSSASPSTPSKLTLRLPANRCSIEPFTCTPSSPSSSRCFSRSRKTPRRPYSSPISRAATTHASPKPTIPGTFSVPDRIPSSCPPPSICAVSLTRGFCLRTYSAPTPLGPYILCALTDIRSMWPASTLTGNLPNAWTASQWNSTFFSRQIAPIWRTGWITPISLLAYITLTKTVSGPIASRSSSRSTSPSGRGRRVVTRQPASSSRLAVSSTAL